MRRLQPLLALLAFVVLFVSSDAAFGQVCLLADFDDDGDPWTIRSECDGESCALNLVFEVPPDPPLDRWFWIEIGPGCCDDDGGIGYYGAEVEMELDMTLIDEYEPVYLTCLCCVPWFLYGHFRADAPMIPGERYVIGTGTATAICETGWYPCEPTHDVKIGFYLQGGDECELSETTMTLNCLTSDAPEGGPLTDAGGVLSAPYPNPVQERMSCRIDLPESGWTVVRVLDAAGRVVTTLIDRELPAGSRTLSWNPIDRSGKLLPRGIYFVRLDGPGVRASRMLVMTR